MSRNSNIEFMMYAPLLSRAKRRRLSQSHPNNKVSRKEPSLQQNGEGSKRKRENDKFDSSSRSLMMVMSSEKRMKAKAPCMSIDDKSGLLLDPVTTIIPVMVPEMLPPPLQEIVSPDMTTLTSCDRISKPLEREILKRDAKRISAKTIRTSTKDTDLTSVRCWKRWIRLLLAPVLGICFLVILQKNNSRIPFHEECVYVNGGGFSGFWYVLGQLHKMHEQHDSPENFLCYSAGCLAAAASIANRSFDDIYGSALSIQNNWKSGNISQYDVLETFIDNLIDHEPILDKSSFTKMNIITTEVFSPRPPADWWGGGRVKIHKLSELKELKKMLIRTSWIPFITGNSLFEISEEGNHLDGLFSILQHPTCGTHVSLSWDLSLRLNTLNVNVGKETARRFWEMGSLYNQ